MNSTARFSITAALLLGAALLLHGRNRGEIIPPRAPLSSFPHTLGNWTSTDIAISKDVLDILGPGDFLLRDFTDSQTKSAVGLFIAYFPSQRSGDTIHSPKNCLPGAGWTPLHSDRITVTLPSRPAFPANRYLIAKGEERQLVLYWYWAHDRGVASEYSAKLYLVADSIRMKRSDGSLVRVATRMAPGETLDAAQQRLLALAADVMPVIDAYVPR